MDHSVALYVRVCMYDMYSTVKYTSRLREEWRKDD